MIQKHKFKSRDTTPGHCPNNVCQPPDFPISSQREGPIHQYTFITSQNWTEKYIYIYI
jgi:hypothetical protein